MRLLMKCQHVIDVDVEKVPSPTCHCGERQIARALEVRQVRIVGHARGPLVETRYLGPTAVALTRPDAPSLRLKPDPVTRTTADA